MASDMDKTMIINLHNKGLSKRKIANTFSIALRHIDSEPRRSLNGDCPGAIARAFIDEKVLP